ncbi:MAG: hypothetical protein JXA30_12500 [Deltaproteobacteria bacterium]|nr:hypothetical protein [Deltaproteobacteria bacterium]
MAQFVPNKTAQKHVGGYHNREFPIPTWLILLILLVVSVLPLTFIAVGSRWMSTRLLMDRSLELQRAMVEGRASAIDFFLEERRRALETFANANSLQSLTQNEALPRVYNLLNDVYRGAFEDLGVIDAEGKHLAYVGRYNLLDKNYRHTEWFRVVNTRGSYISDVFWGYRKNPHFVIAVLHKTDRQRWILRATINSKTFDALVSTAKIGKTGEAFIINREGYYQTQSSSEKMLNKSLLREIRRHDDVESRRIIEQGKAIIQTTAWINSGRWILVVRQHEQEVSAPVDQATFWGALIVIIALVLLIATNVSATWYLTRRIDNANRQKDLYYRDLLQSAKTASLGEMAAGLAHEINKPLAIISAEQTNLWDQLEEIDLDENDKETLINSIERCKRQVERCAIITQKMLRFGEQAEASYEATDIIPLIKETVHLMEQQAHERNINLRLDIEPNVPRVRVDATEMEQVIAHLINNSLMSIENSGSIVISLKRNEYAVELAVRDSGVGIPKEILERICEPFFSARPIGKGTGLGLSVCVAIVRSWGAEIDVQSDPGQGTIVTIRLPVADTSASAEKHHETKVLSCEFSNSFAQRDERR